jgi:plasmid stabilization system protein ParE
MLAATIAIPVLLSALWISLYRFTLADFPGWPVLLFPLLWLVVVFAQTQRPHIARSQRALYLDRTLDLDQRLTTLIELEGKAASTGESEAQSYFRRRLEEEANEVLATRLPLLTGKYNSRLTAWQGLLGAASVACLILALLVPTTFEATRNELNVVRTTVDAQAQLIADLRADLVSRPGVPTNLKEELAAELEQLEEQLRTVSADRAEALATLADVEQKIHEILPNASSAEYEPLIQAARMIQLISASESDWDASLTTETTDLGKAADATRHMKDYVNQFTNPQARAVANTLERAAAVAATKNPELGRQLGEAAGGLRRSEGEKAQAALDEASRLFREAERGEQAATALENTLARLEDSRQTIARAGTAASDRKQVGFRRTSGKAETGESAGSSPGLEGREAQTGGQAGNPNNLASGGPDSGANVPAFGPMTGSGGAGNSQAGDQPGSGGSEGEGSEGGEPTGQTATGAPGGSGGGAGTGANGPVQGPISGPIKGGGGTNNGAGGAQGVGIGPVNGPAGSSEPNAERIYVPGREQPGGGAVGQASPEFQPENGVGGRVGEGPDGAEQPGGPSVGTLTTIRTPYQDVLGEYTEQATEALDRAYVPPDAKEYVRDYFTALGK